MLDLRSAGFGGAFSWVISPPQGALKRPSFRFALGLSSAGHGCSKKRQIVTTASRLFPTKSARAAGDRSGDPRSARCKRTSTARDELRPPCREGSARSQDRHLVGSLPPGRSFPIESCRIALVANRATWLLQYQSVLDQSHIVSIDRPA